MINDAVSPINKTGRTIGGALAPGGDYAAMLYLCNEIEGTDGTAWTLGTSIDIADLGAEIDHTLNLDTVGVVSTVEDQAGTVSVDNKMYTDNLLTISGRLPFSWAADVYNLIMGYALSSIDAYGTQDFADLQAGTLPSTGDIEPHEMKYMVLEWGRRRVTMLDSTATETAMGFSRRIWLYPKTINFHQVSGQGSEMTFTWTFHVIRDPNPTKDQQIVDTMSWWDVMWWQIKIGLSTAIPALSHTLFPDAETNPPPEALENGTPVDWEQKDDEIAGGDGYI